jgi:type IV secretory pathway VirB10-like protein
MFLQDVPLTGLLFCYGPLILTVLGFIVFAALTDGNARRTYLRRKIGPEEKNLANQVKNRTRPMTVATPAGSYLTVQPTPPVQVVPPELPVSSAPPALATGEAAQSSAEAAAEAGPSAEASAAESAEGGEAPKRRRRRSSSSESSESGESGDAGETPASGDESS